MVFQSNSTAVLTISLSVSVFLSPSLSVSSHSRRMLHRDHHLHATFPSDATSLSRQSARFHWVDAQLFSQADQGWLGPVGHRQTRTIPLFYSGEIISPLERVATERQRQQPSAWNQGQATRRRAAHLPVTQIHSEIIWLGRGPFPTPRRQGRRRKSQPQVWRVGICRGHCAERISSSFWP